MVQKPLGAHKNSTTIYKCVFVESDMIEHTLLLFFHLIVFDSVSLTFSETACEGLILSC